MSKRTPVLYMTLGACALVMVSVLGAWAQLQTSDQQKCLNAINKAGSAVAKTQAKESLACLKAAGKGTLVGTAQTCLTADAKGKVAKAQAKTTAADTKSCGSAPSFGFTSAAAVNTAAQQAEVDLVADVYGANLDPAIITCASSKPGCACQQKVSKSVEALAAVKFATFIACKKATLKAGATTVFALIDCVNNAGTVGSIAADSKGKVAKAVTKLKATITKSCDTPNVTAGAFPGSCTALAGTALGDCLDTRVECRVCQAINEMDGLFVNCDLFDDDLANASCASGTGPTPTATPTVTPTPTATQTVAPGQIFVGAISRSSGLFNYDGVNGLAGAEIECDDHFPFPTTHVCTFSELEAAETAGQLVGATDVDALPVVDFWAVVPGADTFTQCISTTGTIPWFYGTAHTSSEGLHAALNNGTGALDPVQTNTCVGGANNGGACTVHADCPGPGQTRCGGPTVECISGNRSVGCCVNP